VDATIASILCDGVFIGFLMSIYNEKTKKVMTINAWEAAPTVATAEMFVNDPKKLIFGVYSK